MTDEQMAEKYATEDLYDGYTKINYVKKRAYLDGLAEGRKERNCVNCSNHGKQFEVMKLKKENEKLKAQVEKMRCCGNCKYCYFWEDFYINMNCSLPNTNIDLGNKCSKWELAE